MTARYVVLVERLAVGVPKELKAPASCHDEIESWAPLSIGLPNNPQEIGAAVFSVWKKKESECDCDANGGVHARGCPEERK